MSRPLSNDIFPSVRAVEAGTERIWLAETSSGAVVEVAVSAERLAQLARQWHDLAPINLEPSPYAAPEWQLPMFRHIGRDDNSVGAMVLGDVTSGYQLRGIVPFRMRKHVCGFPARVLDSWANDLFFLGVPLIPGPDAEPLLGRLVQDARRLLGAQAVMAQMVPAHGPYASALRAAAAKARLPLAELEPFERAGLICDTDFDTWFNDSFSRKRRKEYRRLRARLGESGSLDFSSRAADEPLQPWVDAFIALEQAGWKGKGGTAVACADHVAAFLGETMHAFDASRRLLCWKLAIDDKSIAMLFAVVCGRKAWLIKIAHDEAYARFSPGVLLVLDATRELLGRRDIDVVDSSAVPDHPMINHVWRDRLPMTNIMIATPGTSQAMFDVLVGLETRRRRARAAAKAFYHRYVKRAPK